MPDDNGADALEGVIAAIGAPVVMSLGLLLWEKYWIGSAVRSQSISLHVRLRKNVIRMRVSVSL